MRATITWMYVYAKTGCHEQGGGGGGSGDVNDEGGGNVIGGCVRDEDDDDYLEKMLRTIGSEVIFRNANDLLKLERVKKAAKESLYGDYKGCPTHWTVLYDLRLSCSS